MDTLGNPEALADVSLADRYDLSKTLVLLNGAQAVARLLLMQKERDRRAGLNTGGFISGYRGSPVGGLDLQFIKLKKLFAAADIHFEPGLNEELAATALWGTQQAEMRGEGKFDGVFGLWYGKGPGVDRSGDVFRHANLAGTSPHGGVLALMGDDHTAESSTTAHQSEFAFVDVMMPILSPAGVQEILDYGALGYALEPLRRRLGRHQMHQGHDRIRPPSSTRGSIASTPSFPPTTSCRPAASTSARPTASSIRRRGCRTTSATRWSPGSPPTRSTRRSSPAALRRRSASSPPARAISTCGRRSTISASTRSAATSWACACSSSAARGRSCRRRCTRSPQGLDLIIVVEEKRSLIEVQVREELYGSPTQPICIGKRDEKGEWLFPVKASLDPNQIGVAIGERLLKYHDDAGLRGAVGRLIQARAMRRRHQTGGDAHALFLLGLSAQSLDRDPRGRARLRRHRLPLHGAVHGPRAPTATRRWAARAPTGSARRASPSAATCSRTSATAPTTIPARWRCAGRSTPRPTSPTKSCSTTPSR